MEINDWEYQQLVAKAGILYGKVWRLDIDNKFRIKREDDCTIVLDNFQDLLTWILEETAKAERLPKPDVPTSEASK